MLWGAIVGDIVGSVYEFDNIKTKDFPLFSEHGFITDDSCMTIAVADALMRLAARRGRFAIGGTQIYANNWSVISKYRIWVSLCPLVGQ